MFFSYLLPSHPSPPKPTTKKIDQERLPGFVHKPLGDIVVILWEYALYIFLTL